MSYTREDADAEDGYDRLVDSILAEHSGIIIRQFVEERLAAFYLQNPNISQPAEAILREATMCLHTSRSASVVFAFSHTR